MSQVDPERRLATSALLVILFIPLALAGSLLLLSADIHVPVHGHDDSTGSFCGSAYDVSFLKKDGYMGGEYPPNQAEIDTACMSKSRNFAYPGAGLALLVPVSVVYLLLKLGRPTSRAEKLGTESH